MLSEPQQKRVWDGWLSAENRANYFADLSRGYHRKQRLVTWAMLVLSSGAVGLHASRSGEGKGGNTKSAEENAVSLRFFK